MIADVNSLAKLVRIFKFFIKFSISFRYLATERDGAIALNLFLSTLQFQLSI